MSRIGKPISSLIPEGSKALKQEETPIHPVKRGTCKRPGGGPTTVGVTHAEYFDTNGDKIADVKRIRHDLRGIPGRPAQYELLGENKTWIRDNNNDGLIDDVAEESSSLHKQWLDLNYDGKTDDYVEAVLIKRGGDTPQHFHLSDTNYDGVYDKRGSANEYPDRAVAIAVKAYE